MPPKPLCRAWLLQQPWLICAGSLRSPLPAGLCWKGQQSQTQPLLYQIDLISDIKTRCQGDYVVVCNKSSCYPRYSHVAVLVKQDLYYLSAASLPYDPHFSDSCTKLPQIYKGKADSANRGRRLPPSYGEGGTMLEAKPVWIFKRCSASIPLQEVCWCSRVHFINSDQSQSISSIHPQRFLMTAGLISKSAPVTVKSFV